MKAHTTNYKNTFIEVAEDCPALAGEIPPSKKDEKTVACLQFEMLNKNPYKFTSDDVLFLVYAHRNDLSVKEYAKSRENFFSKGQPCFRASPLAKRYGWGVHNDKEGKIAIVGVDSIAYKKLSKDKSLKVIKAMRSSK